MATIDDTQRSDDGTLLPQTVVPSTGERLLMEALPPLKGQHADGDLELKETIGRGGMGVVRVAEQHAIGRNVAVKALRADHQGDRALALALLREAWVTGALEHPNVIPVYGIGKDERGDPLIVMKRVQGTPWSEVLKQRNEDLRWHLRILMQVANAVDFAGSRGIVHRDLKPDNVMIGSFGEVYVLDWGIAVALTDDRGGRLPLAREVRGISGTPGYLAPEMVQETGEGLSVRTDVYLLGAILHELITRAPRHQAPDVQASLLSALESAPYRYEPHVPEELVAICHRALQREPAQRFESAGALRRALELFLEHESSRELLDQARQRLAAWRRLETDGGRADPVLVQRYFGEARFALQQALREWAGNTEARAELARALEQKFLHDLARDDFESAAVALDELGEWQSGHKERLDQLAARMATRRAELTALRALQAGRDLDVGRRTRAFLVLVAGLFGGAVCFLAPQVGATGLAGYPYFYGAAAVKLAGGAALGYWARDSLGKTLVNRQLSFSLLLMIVAETAFRAFSQGMERPLENALMVDYGIYFLVCSTLAITVDRRLALASLAYAAGALLSHRRLEHVYEILGLTHLTSSLVSAYVWRPSRLRGPDLKPER